MASHPLTGSTSTSAPATGRRVRWSAHPIIGAALLGLGRAPTAAAAGMHSPSFLLWSGCCAPQRGSGVSRWAVVVDIPDLSGVVAAEVAQKRRGGLVGGDEVALGVVGAETFV